MGRFITALSLSLLLTGVVASIGSAQWYPVPIRPWPALTTAPSSTTTTSSQPAPAPRPGQLRCIAEDNGVPSSGSLEVFQSGRLVARGTCAFPLSLPAGSYVAAITLDTALDRPTRSVPVVVGEGAEALARASFSTALLEVRFTDGASPAYGIADVRRNGVTLGTLGSNVVARVSAGTYDVVARYRTQERSFTVTLGVGERRALRAAF